MNMSEESIRRKILACWVGKNIGGTLGGPFEGYPETHELTFYDPVPTEAMPNDDLELQAMYAAALDRMEHPEVNRMVLADIWRKHMNFHVDEYAVAMKNLASGVLPPWSGAWDNCFTEGMGSAIRSEIWACLAPGDPDLAAKYAYEDACIDHDGAGIDAEIFFAVLESLAFVESDIRKLISAALERIPADSKLAAGIRDACSLWDSTHDWRHVRDTLFERYASEFRTSVLINIPFTVLALLSGNGDFGKTICDAANCGMDTDCTAATAGAILGIVDPDCIPDKWKAPVGDALIVRKTAVTGLDFPPTIEAFTDQIISLRGRIPAGVREISAAEPDRSAIEIPVDIAMLKNPSWYRIDWKKLNWVSSRCNSIYSELAVPEEFRGNGGQIVLRFRFVLPEDTEYTVMFNSPTSNQVYLDPEEDLLRDDHHMLFGRQRLWTERVGFGEHFPCSERKAIFCPTLGGTPLNQYKRYIPLKRGEHTLIVALEPQTDEPEIFWGFGIGIEKTHFLTGIFH